MIVEGDVRDAIVTGKGVYLDVVGTSKGEPWVLYFRAPPLDSTRHGSGIGIGFQTELHEGPWSIGIYPLKLTAGTTLIWRDSWTAFDSRHEHQLVWIWIVWLQVEYLSHIFWTQRNGAHQDRQMIDFLHNSLRISNKNAGVDSFHLQIPTRMC